MSILSIETKAKEFYNSSGILYLKIEDIENESIAHQSKNDIAKTRNFVYPSPLKNTAKYIAYDFEIYNYEKAVKFFRPKIVDCLKQLHTLCDNYNKNKDEFLLKEEHLLGNEYLNALRGIFTDSSLIVEEIERLKNRLYSLRFLKRINDLKQLLLTNSSLIWEITKKK